MFKLRFSLNNPGFLVALVAVLSLTLTAVRWSIGSELAPISKTEAQRLSELKDSFSPERAPRTCKAFPVDEKVRCFIQRTEEIFGEKKLSVSAYAILYSLGALVVLQEQQKSRQAPTATTKLDLAELSLFVAKGIGKAHLSQRAPASSDEDTGSFSQKFFQQLLTRSEEGLSGISNTDSQNQKRLQTLRRELNSLKNLTLSQR